MTQIWKNQAFTISHAARGEFSGADLRPFFEHRDPDIKDATQGVQVLRAGSCIVPPPGIRRRELRHPGDLELPEIVSPADFATHQEVSP